MFPPCPLRCLDGDKSADKGEMLLLAHHKQHFVFAGKMFALCRVNTAPESFLNATEKGS